MNDLINKAELLAKFRKKAIDEEYKRYEIESIINSMPTVDTERHGHWEEEEIRTLDNMNVFTIYRCSECGESTDTENLPYCYWCGAKMDEEENDV